MAEAEVDARATGDEGRGGGGGSVAEDGQPAAAKGGAVTAVLLALLVASVAAFLTSSLPRPGDGDGVGEGVGKGVQGAVGRAGEVAGKRAEPVELAVGDAVGIPGFNSRLDAFRTWAALKWMKLRRPRADEPRYDAAAAGSAGSVADAAKRSFEMGKETVEQAAATTVRATRDAAETAKEKVKGAASPPDGAEL
ncbi:uncharacterized protein [Miscanthus floridulus]|uniref:uncharacterized protein n=1 Tax=Miscanthus floridulus TaxID=154761 RepID=UPI003458F791